MASSLQRWSAWSAWVIATVAVAAALGLSAGGGGAVSWVVLPGVPALGYCSVGLVLGLRVPGNRIGWLFVISGLVLSLGLLSDAYAYSAHALALPGRPAAAAAANLLELIAFNLLPPLLLLFPGGRLPSSRWRLPARLWTTGVGVLWLCILVEPGGMVSLASDSLDNPLGIGGRIRHAVGAGSFVLVFGSVIVTAGSLAWRYRRATGEARQQFKWFGAAGVLMACAFVGIGLVVHWGGQELAWRVATVVLPLAFTGVIVATGIAILRYRLYEIDVIIRKTLVYATLVGALAVVYLGCIYVADALLQAVTGQSGALAVTLSTLAVAAAFQPLRGHIRRAVDHRFYRAHYDAAATLDAFTGRLRDQIDLDALRGEMIAVVQQTLQPSHATLWLRQAERNRR